MADLIQMRGDIAQEWELADPIIHDRELVFTVDPTGMAITKMKLGTGKKYSETPFFAGLNGTNGANGLDGKDGAKGEKGEAGTNGIDGKDGESADHDAVVVLQGNIVTLQGTISSLQADLKTLKEQPWAIVSVMPLPLPADIEIGIPLTRAGIMKVIDFRVYGVFTANTTITVKQNGTSIGTQLITKLGLTTLTLSKDIVGALDDTFSYSVNADGLKGAIVVCNQKWVNK